MMMSHIVWNSTIMDLSRLIFLITPLRCICPAKIRVNSLSTPYSNTALVIGPIVMPFVLVSQRGLLSPGLLVSGRPRPVHTLPSCMGSTKFSNIVIRRLDAGVYIDLGFYLRVRSVGVSGLEE